MPTQNVVVDYFRWRAEDAHRNALNAHCYWMLRKEILSKSDAAIFIEKKSLAEKSALLLSRGIDFNALPNWQKRGIGMYWANEERKGFDPKQQIEVVTRRNMLRVELGAPQSVVSFTSSNRVVQDCVGAADVTLATMCASASGRYNWVWLTQLRLSSAMLMVFSPWAR